MILWSSEPHLATREAPDRNDHDDGGDDDDDDDAVGL